MSWIDMDPESHKAFLKHCADVRNSPEPDFISQTGEATTGDERREWFRARTDDARAAGAVLCRYSLHETILNLCLFEAWKTQPADQGEIRWQLTSTPQPNVDEGDGK